MSILAVGEKPGAASAMKLLRSVCMKGLAALLVESLVEVKAAAAVAVRTPARAVRA